MEVPAKYIVETVDITSDDVLLPMLECVVNSIISLQKSDIPKEQKKIQIQIERGELPDRLNFNNAQTIKSYKIIDNGIGFNTENYQSFKTPFSQVNKEEFGCKGIGRFTVLAAFEEYSVISNYEENGKWFHRSFKFSTESEINSVHFHESELAEYKTIVEIKNCNDQTILQNSALTVTQIAEGIMQHCFIYYLNENLPEIEVVDFQNQDGESVNDLFKKVSKENQRDFPLKGEQFRLYITKTFKEGNRRNNYLHYCANNRAVGNPRNLKNVNSIFTYPVLLSSQYYFFDIYLVSDFLNRKVFKTRNGFNIQKEKENLLFDSDTIITLQEIEEKVSEIIEEEYQDFVKDAKEKNLNTIQTYIYQKAPRYNSFLKNPEILQSIPPNLSEDKLEEQLYRISFSARKTVENNIKKFITNKQVNEEAISHIIDDIKAKTAYDVDSLADYMTRRKAIIELFDKFLDADENGSYKLEEDVHNLIFPLGITNNELDYENHNLWLLDERFITYKFIASDKPITSYSQKDSRKELDLILLDNPKMFDNPLSFGDRNSGDINSMVIFEFKRPGDTAHQKNKNDFRWEFSELIKPYFGEFLYKSDKKNYKGNHVVVQKTTPKYGFIIMDVIPNQLADFNIESCGWQKTPFGSYFKIEPGINLHMEVMTFRKLVDFSKERHNPFFDRLFK
jgi:hypothetical protein